MSRRQRACCGMLVLAVVSALTACGGSLFASKARPPSFYLLSAQAGTTGPEIAADLTVLRPLVRSGLDTDRIAVLYPDRHLAYYADTRWNARLDQVVQDLASQTLHTHANLRSVTSDASAFSAGYWLEIEVTDFQAEYAAGQASPTIHVHLRAAVGKASDRRVLDRFEANATQAATDNRMTAIVAAYEQAADSALEQIVSETVRSLDKNARVTGGR
ncbi:MAG: ABC-type transport auxiliary lipoprotein family protein [Steroidobacterales bacterium]